MPRSSLTLALLLLPATALAQTPQPIPRDSTPKETALPVTRVSLYKNGVGFFEHTGRISGNASVTIDFTSAQLNDVLQSLTAIDLNGGRIAGAGYNSTTPLDQQLKNLPLALGADPTAIEFYNAIRGARVEVHAGAISTGVPGGRSLPAGVAITGRLLSMEERTTPPPDSNDARTPTSRQFFTVVSDTGETRTLELTPTTSIRLLDTALHTDVSRYLQLLDSNRNQGLRHLTLTDNGSGPRELHLSYISEVPIWKSTYRILFTDGNKSPGAPSIASSAMGGGAQTATLQGWSVVDNTTGTDWTNVQLSLIAGAPQSFIQPLSQPIYSRRPEIPISEEAQLTPQTHDSSIDGLGEASESVTVSADAAPRAMLQSKMASSSRAVSGVRLGIAGGTGVGSGSGGNIGGGVLNAPAPPPSYQEEAAASLAPATTTAAFDDFFAYNLTEPVTILKNQSALVPILQSKILADRVTLVSSNGNSTSQPLRALWVTNSSGLTLDRGSFTIVENGNFGGEGLLDPIHAGEKRLLSYAADQAVHVSTEGGKSTTHVTFLRGSKGVLNIHHADLSEITYDLHNSASEPRTIVLEHPLDRGLKLDSQTPTPTETTASLYRFRLTVAPGETAKLHIGGERDGYNTYYLTRSDDNQLTLILNQSDHNPALIAALQPILDARRKVSDAQTAVNQTNDKLKSLHADEERQRANITALASADKSSRDRFVNDLNHTEDAIASNQSELTTRTTALDAAKADLATRIENFQIDTK